METLQNNPVSTTNSVRPDSDNCPAGSSKLSFGRSTFPHDAKARIYRPARSAMTCAKPRRAWRLSFDRRSAPFIEPLMGYTGSRDTLTQVDLSFPTREAAIAYAARQGLTYVVHDDASRHDRHDPAACRKMEEQAFSDIVQKRLQIAWLQASQNRSVLKNRAWNEYLIDLVTAEGMPENGRPARSADVELALRAFESRIGGSKSAVRLVQGRMAA